ncbi:uncharacterized protein LOC106011017 [Aplysia californica]|uniref:Uncharacterized protein LOC106011017 n=1 Tax=Aplysia californica TaxID=6500 RepID=A0ABM0ZU80_APLCA|nr:uncharacterized protein LOC106011017 [Aplysia californica]
MEKIVAKRLANYLERKKLLPDGLGSYRPGKDTCTNMAVLAFDVFESFQRKEETAMAAVDLEDVYNRVDYCKLMDLLMEMDVDPYRQHELKYLRITLDRTLSFRRHIDNVTVGAQKGINVVKTLASVGIQQRVLFLLMQLVVHFVIDYGLGILSLSKTQKGRLERVQNAAVRAVLGCTKDTHVVCMRYILDLASIGVRHKVAQAKLYLNVLGDPRHPLHDNLSSIKGNRVKRGSSWMAGAEDSLRKIFRTSPLPLVITGFHCSSGTWTSKLLEQKCKMVAA